MVLTATAAPAPPDGAEFFEKNIRPVLAERCYKCHGATSEKIKGGLVLETADGLTSGGDNGAILVAGDVEKSRLITALRYTDSELQMPPPKSGQLSADQIKNFETWVKMGAPDPRPRSAVAATTKPSIDFEEARKFWSYQPVKDPAIPNIVDQAWPLGAVDHFILAKLEAQHLTPAAQTGRRTLIRRATFDLTGLPPTPEEVDAFVADDSPTAFEKLVDRLLATKQYGERWGRHWLDVVRYADTSGCNSDFPVPSAFRYRNYVIDSFNRDKPFDQFVREQLAGDLLPAKDDAQKQEQTIATGYLAIARRFGSRAAEFHLTIEDTIDNVGKGMLGLSVSCARCHDHKFDPIPNRDYYALYGIFNSTTYAFPGTEVYRHSKDFVLMGKPEDVAAAKKNAADLADLDNLLEHLTNERRPLEQLTKAAMATTQASTRPSATTMPSINGRTLLQVIADQEAAKGKLRGLELKTFNVEKAYAVGEGTPADAKIQKKGDPTALGAKVPRGFLEVLGGQHLPAEEKGSGRLELAQWITDSSNPLFARVMVNRIWQNHFGKGIVQTPNDFGVRGKRPTNPELLDYLATRFVQSGFSVKAMHKIIMLSRAYQLSCADDAKNAAIDNANDSLWRFTRRRLSAEEIRDAMLAVSGTLNKSQGMAHAFPPEVEWKYTQHTPFVAAYETNRRSVYLMQQRIRKQPFLDVFDGADTNVTTADRPMSITAIQALFMMNDPLVHDLSDKFAVRVGMACPAEVERIGYAYRLALGRPPTADEVRMGRDYLRECRARMKDVNVAWDQQSRMALASYMRVVVSSNEFFFVD